MAACRTWRRWASGVRLPSGPCGRTALNLPLPESGSELQLLAWIALGLVSGLIANLTINRRGEDLILNTVPGLIGAVLGGWLCCALEWPMSAG